LPISTGACRRACGRDQREAGGEPVGLAVTQRRNLRRDRAGSVGGAAGPALSGGDLTQIATVIAGRSRVASERVTGSGTILDSARFRTLLAAHLGNSPAY
jgi:hypothetical protein